MEIIKTSIEGLVIIKPMVFEDERGYFQELFKETFIKENFPDLDFIQVNESKSGKNVLRGLHYQKSKYAQTKLVRVVTGSILDVVVDLRKESKTYGHHLTFKLSSSNKLQLLVPKGFAHGFIVQSEEAIIQYFVDEPYSKKHEAGINYMSSKLKIDWGLEKGIRPILSSKDKCLPDWPEIF